MNRSKIKLVLLTIFAWLCAAMLLYTVFMKAKQFFKF